MLWVCAKPRLVPLPCGVSVGFELSSYGDKQGRRYRAKAREAEQLAQQTNNSVIKEQALKIAEQWRYMADLRRKARATLGPPMTTLTLRRIKDHFVVTGPDIEPTRQILRAHGI